MPNRRSSIATCVARAVTAGKIIALIGALVGVGACKVKLQKQPKKDTLPIREEDAAGIRAPGGADATRRGDLATYLLTTDEAAALQPIVMPFRPSTLRDPGGHYTERFAKYGAFVEGFLNRAMVLQTLSPGRKLEVRIEDDLSINAYAGAFQDVTITVGTIQSVEAIDLLAVLCHELAHSAHNHSVAHAHFTRQPEMVQDLRTWNTTFDAYLAGRYDTRTSAYTHNVAEYRKALAAWQLVAPRLDTFTKRQEAEADVIGAQICGQLGMPPATYTEAVYRFLAAGEAAVKAAGGVGPDALQDGERFNLNADQLRLFLFPNDSHPTLAERRANLERTQPVIARYFDADAPLFSEWTAAYRGVAQESDLSAGQGLGLADAARVNVTGVTTESGRLIVVVKKPLCGK